MQQKKLAVKVQCVIKKMVYSCAPNWKILLKNI